MIDQMLIQNCGATFSPCRTWRYHLWRRWDWNTDGPLVGWILLNPSTAAEMANDPTINRCVRFAKDWGYAGLHIYNLFAFRATHPKNMKAAADPVGPQNDHVISTRTKECRELVVGWGMDGSFQGRASAVAQMLGNVPLLCLGTNSDGSPTHPLYVPANKRLEAWSLAG